MVGCEMADFWLFGKWLPAGYPAAVTSPGDASVDIFGQTISIGSLVKLVGVVTALNPLDPHFQDIVFTPLFPQSPFVTNTVGVAPQQQPLVSVKCHPLQLIMVGSAN
jgi:hypothetical protein